VRKANPIVQEAMNDLGALSAKHPLANYKTRADNFDD